MKLLLIVLVFLSSVYAKKDFYYGFIDSSGNQISQRRTQVIEDGFEIIKNIRILANDGKTNEAYSQIKVFKEQNKIKILNSDIILLYSELALKKGSRRFMLEASRELEKTINDSKIHENDLYKAYMVLVELKLKTNKAKDAKYFANIIINNFDNKVINAYGQISLAKVYRYQRDYRKATKILYEILTKTTDVLVATLVADELFDVYILDKKRKKAYALISKVLKKNMNYYSNNPFLALKKVNRLTKAEMPEFAIEILEELLERTNKSSSVESFKFKLANSYMDMYMYKRTDNYLLKAKELYKDIINDFKDGIYLKKAKMYLDEILMRERKIKPSVLAQKYKNSESMKQKILLQELLNDKLDNKYEIILKSKKVYKRISNSIAKRFGYESMNIIFDEVNIDMIKSYLKTDKCFLLNRALKTSRNETLERLIKEEEIKFKFFECLIEVPYEKAYILLKDTFNASRDANIYLYLERMAMALRKFTEAEGFSTKVDMVNDKKVLSKEFLYRFLLLSQKGDSIDLDNYFNYAYRNQNFISDNSNNPIIIDFYYNYYLYLIKKGLFNDANNILNKLYKKQHELKAYIYSPFVELELAKILKTNNKNQEALDLLLNSIDYSRKIKPNDLAKTYYELIRLYEEFNNKQQKDKFINKCKSIEKTKDSLYKKMCDEM